ncbi:hypothetical protein PARPLA_01740 [Rhodobacteraceae bacterium THAF1]|uniref:DUF4112 domain-containing protein n=1 Tax=Palleronia sp. THAF1 TaxID=2587842 RepID=UPI000F4019AD|nr:DUF4112 domain-containing protein [Palleronia sp. THAF1]QFU09125.1 hypothetical protein FIU81_10605 [Palleronia sp. THAF1]VDC24067.1 hypothetical protein PARPLA_01740 [Rhodobacteraceae bacterium THAF1]
MNTHPKLARLEKLDRLSRRMDTAFRIPIIGKRVGWDGILSILPVVGDTVAFAPAAYIVLESHRMGLPRHKVIRQGINVGIDYLVGSIPIIGTLFDIGFKANRANVAILRDHVERETQAELKDVTPGGGALSSHHPSIGDRV